MAEDTDMNPEEKEDQCKTDAKIEELELQLSQALEPVRRAPGSANALQGGSG